MKTRMLALLASALLVGLFPLRAQDFEFELPEEEAPRERQEDVVIIEERAPVDGFIPRLFRFLGGARAVSARGDATADPWREGTVSTDPDDPERKPRGTILFSFNW